MDKSVPKLTSTQITHNSLIPWIEKYRPQTLNDLQLDPMIVRQIKAIINSTNINSNKHIIITGDPGVGKTSTARCIAREIFGADYNEGLLEINGGNDRGVKAINSIIPSFCNKIVNFQKPKIILFDEADNITVKCQKDITQMINKYGQKNKFIFVCNNSANISEDIQSVCIIKHFKKITNEQMILYMSNICQKEGIEYTTDGMKTICIISNGDMRRAINNLQTTAMSFGKITKKNVLLICQVPDADDIINIIQCCCKGDLIMASKYMEKIGHEGYNCSDIVSMFQKVMTTYNEKDLSEKQKLDIHISISKYNTIMNKGINTKLQLNAMLSEIYLIVNNK